MKEMRVDCDTTIMAMLNLRLDGNSFLEEETTLLAISFVGLRCKSGNCSWIARREPDLDLTEGTLQEPSQQESILVTSRLVLTPASLGVHSLKSRPGFKSKTWKCTFPLLSMPWWSKHLALRPVGVSDFKKPDKPSIPPTP